jgi:hypothetical protein
MTRIIVLPEQLELLQGQLKKIETLLSRQQPNIPDPILDSESLMQLLKVSRRWLQNRRDDGTIEFAAVGGKFYYKLSSVYQMLEKHTINTEVYHG